MKMRPYGTPSWRSSVRVVFIGGSTVEYSAVDASWAGECPVHRSRAGIGEMRGKWPVAFWHAL